MTAPSPRFFKSQDELRRWLHKYHASRDELWVGFFKKAADEDGISYAEALDEALAYGWIDGVRKGLDEARWTIRFTPRKPKSQWSAVNRRRVPELIALGRMTPAGLAAWERREAKNATPYSYENRKQIALAPELDAKLRSDRRASAFFDAQPPSYQHAARHWIMSAKKDETRARRLGALLASSRNGERVASLIPPGRKKATTKRS